MSAAALAAFAIVAADQAPLRAAPAGAAAVHARLTQGDLLEVRGTRLDHLQVYDHRRERAGYIKASQVRAVDLDAREAPQLLATLLFLRDAPGLESLGIAYVAAYLKAAPAAAIGPEVFDALGVMAERLADRAAKPGASDATAAQVEAVAPYGVRFAGHEQHGAVRLCYDGDAFRRVLAFQRATAEQRARAALALTRHDCVDAGLRPGERLALDRARAALLNGIGAADMALLDGGTTNRLRLRRAGVWAAIAHAEARRGEPAQQAGARAVEALTGVDKGELADDDADAWAEAALRVGASRWAAEPALTPPLGKLQLRVRDGEPGQRCVRPVDGAPAAAERCTYGTVWAASARASADGRALVVQVQQTETWTELWLWRRGSDGWSVDVLPPAPLQPDVGYAEFAGWMPGDGGGKLLVAREARAEGRTVRRFEVVSLASLAVERWAGSPEVLAAFTRWAEPQWKRASVSQR